MEEDYTKKFYKDADELLGNKEKRYFGNGYKYVNYKITNVILFSSSINAHASIKYPSSWSKKDEETDLIPHLSTIDVTYIALQLCELFLMTLLMLDDEERSNIFIKVLKLHSGDSPTENLSKVDAILTHTHQQNKNSISHIFKGQIGNIKIYTELELADHSNLELRLNRIVYNDVENILGKNQNRYFGNIYEKTNHYIKNIMTNTTTLESNAEIQIENNIFDRNKNYGIDTNYLSEFTPSIIDCIVVIAQLSQILIYDMDSLQREESNTLWMRKIEIHRSREAKNQFEQSQIKVKRTKVLNMKDASWRIIDMNGNFFNYQFDYSLAHMLPKKEGE